MSEKPNNEVREYYDDCDRRNRSLSLRERLEGLDARVRNELEQAPELFGGGIGIPGGYNVTKGWHSSDDLIHIVAKVTIPTRLEDQNNPIFSITAAVQRVVAQARSELRTDRFNGMEGGKDQKEGGKSFDC